MASIKLYKKLKEIYNDRLSNITLVTNSKLNIIDNNIEIDLNGKPSSILIDYTGVGMFQSKMPIDIKVKISKNKILIVNTFKKDIPSVMFSFSGNINIVNCQIMNFNSTKIQSSINNNQNENIIDKQKTNVEDMDLVLYDKSRSEDTRPFKAGLIKRTIKKSSINKFSKIKKYGKTEAKTIAKTIINTARRINSEQEGNY